MSKSLKLINDFLYSLYEGYDEIIEGIELVVPLSVYQRIKAEVSELRYFKDVEKEISGNELHFLIVNGVKVIVKLKKR